MAKTDSTEPMVRKDLTEAQVNERRDVLVARLDERDKIDEQKKAQDKKWNEQLRLLDEQISQLGREIRERAALVPSQLEFGGDASAPPPIPGAQVLGGTGKKKRGKAAKKRAPRKKAPANGVATAP